MKDIVIDGINLSEIKAKQEAYNKEVAAVRGQIKQGAAAFISERIEEAKATVAKLKLEMEAEDPVHANIVALATEATEALELVEFVSGVSGVSYSLPFPDSTYSYGGFADDEIITNVIENSSIGGKYYWNLRDDTETLPVYNALNALYRQAESLESEVQEWNSSYC